MVVAEEEDTILVIIEGGVIVEFIIVVTVKAKIADRDTRKAEGMVVSGETPTKNDLVSNYFFI